MSIHEDARKGILVGDVLDNHIKKIFTEQDPDSGLTPLAIAVVEGFPEEVEQLLKKGARADGLSKKGETPLLLAAWKTLRERARIIQLLLAGGFLPGFVDKTCSEARNNTPLMFAIQKGDLESIRLLRKAGASLRITNDDNKSAEDMAKEKNEKAIYRALDPDEEPLRLARLTNDIVDYLRYIIAWVNESSNGAVRDVSGLDPEIDQDLDEVGKPDRSNDWAMGNTEDTTTDEFLKNVDKYVKITTDGILERFFGDKKDFVRDIARKIVDWAQVSTAGREAKDVPQRRVKVPLYRPVIYCDDSTSMKREGRWENQKALVQRIARITTRLLPEGEGVSLRFINRDVTEPDDLGLEELGEILRDMPWQPGGDTPIGTNLRSKILEPLVYSKIREKKLKRPLLVIMITDGMPEPESKSEIVNVILECERKLQEGGYPPETVKFMIGQIGTGKSATRFLEYLRQNSDISRSTFVTSERLDEKFADYRGNGRELDRWLVETMFSPFLKSTN
ncbi:hypothetical protein GGS23DRAFT_592026 [Durotheca rogersii]|uniref:uncharacterized protein n=1 Tax=Durotheca rogersii TaxID=419775 RepID=UPI00222129F7|nr:uncharacterized protein GGS23DRAFT_592026 [Durotheca rogersii]KAI5868238.1 hypothetical protein GGS23DRAFT_592026 [Durotheca rogersii]